MAQSGRDSDGNNLIHNQSIIVPANLITIADSFEKKEHSWFVASHIPTDLSIQIQGITFHVHKKMLRLNCSEGFPRKPTGEMTNEESWWFKDSATLRIDHFVRIITALRAKGLKPEIIGSCIMYYAGKWRHEGNVGHNKEQKMIIESLVSILPPQKEAVSCKFLLAMLKMALVYSASPALVSELEKRVGMVLENADANDLLVPSCTRDQGKTLNKLLDNYLAEVAKDPNLSITKFQALAEALPVKARTCHDGIYRAIDTYLKSHPSLSEHERRRLCKIMDCKKLSLDACIHAAQNDRLPLRIIMQVLLSEQIKMRAAMQGKEQAASGNNSDQEESWTSKEEIKILKDELLKVKVEVQGLQKDYTELQRIYGNVNNKRRSLSGWTLGWRKIKNSGFFNRKTEGDETRVEQQRSTSSGLRVSLRRRLSMF
ncbi:phototropic-responsive NPH3 family protein [Actinidia rufa]|uniref:Phototropic-responsive NPH3 family protein n=1 Tax=Actinidia rufa TaxID=165716 RepID=A0A7J0E168_9ERIC|nr:phototropic-responsive NPH3 family protein [Actinidia rufa]